MSNRTVIATIALFFAFSLSAQDLLTPKDSVFMYANEGGIKYLEHPVKKGQTLYGISKFYTLSMEDIYYYNPQLGNMPTLEVGQRINIPIPNAAISRYMLKGMNAKEYARLYYVVQPGETLYHISKRHFGMSVDSVKARNGLKDANIKVGQRLFVGWFTIKGIKAEWRGTKPADIAPPVSGTNQMTQGVASWQHTSTEKSVEMNCLHSEAKVGTMMAVKFPVTQKRIYVKVIGRLPVGTSSNIQMILSPAAARALGAKDPKILVEMEYVK